jgi:hypothetical protein
MAGEQHPGQSVIYLTLGHISRDEGVKHLFRPLSRH